MAKIKEENKEDKPYTLILEHGSELLVEENKRGRFKMQEMEGKL